MVISDGLVKVIESLRVASLKIPQRWDGRESILAMKDADNRQWRQMEWMGFFFQFLCENMYKDILEIPGKRYGNTEFDGTGGICWDFKAHAANTMSHQVITNDSTAIANAIEEYGHYGLVLAIGEVEYNDEERTFKQWHDRLKGGRSDYETARIARGAMSRRRKTEFVLSEIHFVCLDAEALNICGGSFQEGFRNSDGSPRRSKVQVNVEKIPDDAMITTVEF